jgi:hypothetical protein
MKIIKIILFGFLSLSLVLGAAVFIFFQIFDADQYLSQITKQASAAVGRPVSAKGIGLGLSWRGITVDVRPATVADEQEFTAQPFLKVEKVRVSVDFKSLILRHKVRITNVLLQSPQIHFIHSQDGSINAMSLGASTAALHSRPNKVFASSSADSKVISIRSTLTPRPSQDPPWSFDFGRPSITLQDASITFIDQNQVMPLDIWISGINANLNNFSMSQQLQLSFSAAWRILDSSIFKNVAGAMRLNISHLDISAPADLEASGNINIASGSIKNFNFIKTILSNTLGNFGMTGGHIDNLLSGPLGAQDTIIEKAQAGFSVRQQAFSIDDFLVRTNIFEFAVKGTVDKGLNTDLHTVLHLSSDVSAAFINEFKGFKILCDDTDRITIPASLNGVIPHLKYKPDKDFRKKSKKALMEEGGNILGVLLGGWQ